MSELKQRIDESADHIRKTHPFEPRVGMILGTGLGNVGETMEVTAKIPFAEIPHFPHSTAPGHEGNL